MNGYKNVYGVKHVFGRVNVFVTVRKGNNNPVRKSLASARLSFVLLNFVVIKKYNVLSLV